MFVGGIQLTSSPLRILCLQIPHLPGNWARKGLGMLACCPVQEFKYLGWIQASANAIAPIPVGNHLSISTPYGALCRCGTFLTAQFILSAYAPIVVVTVVAWPELDAD